MYVCLSLVRYFFRDVFLSFLSSLYFFIYVTHSLVMSSGRSLFLCYLFLWFVFSLYAVPPLFLYVFHEFVIYVPLFMYVFLR